jgi:hypothetical protein
MMRTALLLLVLFLIRVHPCSSVVNASASEVLYENNFEKLQPGKMPDELMVLEGGFSIKADATNKFVELPGAPLETFAFLFGPTETENVNATARFFGTGKGRRGPTFALGLNGVGGYKLQVAPSKRVIELIKGDTDVLASAPYKWDSGSWTMLRLQVLKLKDGEWKIEGKAWPQGAPEPQTWTISHNEKNPPIPGRAGIWASPYSETPIRFDDVRLERAPRS